MKNRFVLIATVHLVFIAIINGIGQIRPGDGKDPYIIPTYECAGIYWKVRENGECQQLWY